MQLMTLILALFISVSSVTAADLDHIGIKQLNLDYTAPYGQGELEKLEIDLGLAPTKLSVEVFRRENSILLQTPFIDFSWNDPLAFVHNLEFLQTRNFNLKAGHKTHHVQAERLIFRPAEQGDFTLNELRLGCAGQSTHSDLHIRMMEDCQRKMEGRITKVDLPMDFFLIDVLSRMPDTPEETDIPAWNVFLNMEKGDFYLSLYIRNIFRARLHAWGHLAYENDFKTVAIRVDRVRYGVLPVTSLVMRELKRRINHPKVKIDAPWIRIELE